MTEPSAAERPSSGRSTFGRTTSGRPGEPAGQGATPSVCVVVPYYEDQPGLDRLLTALELQTIGHARLEVVVADDGSPTQPTIGRRPFPVRVVRQEDRGFRAAAARNLGAAAASAPVVAFVDGDMVPEPDYLAQLVRRVDERTLCVAWRRHADLAGWGPDRLRTWLAGAAPGPPVLDEPAWLRDGYAATADLTRADDTSYRFVISAVLAAPRAMLRRLGGFAEEFTDYGGEDWDLAHRWRHAGGALRYVPGALAWHDGPDFAGRDDAARRRAVKDVETMRLAGRVSVPGARDPRLLWTVPDVAIHVDGTDLTPAQVLAVAAPLVDGTDAAIWVRGLPPVLLEGLQDPRIRHDEAPNEGHAHGGVDTAALPAGSRYVVVVRRPGVLRQTSLADVIATWAEIKEENAAVEAVPSDQAVPNDQAGEAQAAVEGTPSLGAPSSTVATDDDGPLHITHVPTGRAWSPALPPGQWEDLPGPTTSIEQLWDGLRRAR